MLSIIGHQESAPLKPSELLVWLQEQAVESVDKAIDKLILSYIADINVKGCSHCIKQFKNASELNYIATM